ncbi:MAG: head-tail connector protein [Firmicutes bacterium]|nr:head-tail connector protein [Bacillota bacterium]
MITLAEAKEFLRIDHTEEDGYVNILILLSREMAENYLRHSLPEILPESIKQAMLIVIAHFYEKRDGEPVPDVVFRLLDFYRKEAF